MRTKIAEGKGGLSQSNRFAPLYATPFGGVARGSQSPYLGGQGSGPGSGVFSQQQQQQPTSQPTAPLPQQPGNQQQQQYPSYPQRYPTPPGPGPVGRAAFSPHQASLRRPLEYNMFRHIYGAIIRTFDYACVSSSSEYQKTNW
uniref:Uncharacterized protein n=1 Tax=Timema monikensis TaxID=170555 RepID=A0A7R9HLG0_9NEOP|nr:unnamed protein product [Timema monikensis]